MLKKRNKRRNVALVVAGCLLALVILVIVLIVTSGGKGVEVPDLLGLTYKEAKQRIKSAKLVIEIDPRQDVSDESQMEGKKVIAQDPAKGQSAEQGTLVTVILKGVPDKPTTRNGNNGTTPGPAGSTPSTQPQNTQPAEPQTPAAPALVAPVEGKPVYPFTRDASIACGHWESGSQDYPYFGAPRDGNSRTHAGIDIYPQGGEGAAVRAMKDGTVIKLAPFYTRASGEVTYGLLVDHGDFVANYAELKPPGLGVGSAVKQGQVIGAISGTDQLHLEMYDPGTRDWTSGWYGTRPSNLRDPTQTMIDLGL
jgi:PASTA domain/Peptidase family M23